MSRYSNRLSSLWISMCQNVNIIIINIDLPIWWSALSPKLTATPNCQYECVFTHSCWCGCKCQPLALEFTWFLEISLQWRYSAPLVSWSTTVNLMNRRFSPALGSVMKCSPRRSDSPKAFSGWNDECSGLTWLRKIGVQTWALSCLVLSCLV